MPQRKITLLATWSEEGDATTSRHLAAIYTVHTDGTFGDALRRILTGDYRVETFDPATRGIDLAEHLHTPGMAIMRLPSDPVLEWLEDSHRSLGITRASLLTLPIVDRELQRLQTHRDTLLLGALAANLSHLDTDGRVHFDTTVDWDPTQEKF